MDIVGAITADAVRLQLDVGGLGVDETETIAIPTPSLPKLRSLILIEAELESFDLFASIAPNLTTLEVSLAPSHDEYITIRPDDLDFRKMPSAATVERLVIRNGVHSPQVLAVLPKLAHLDVFLQSVELSALPLLAVKRPLTSLRLRAIDEEYLTVLVALVHLAISQREASEVPLCREITLVTDRWAGVDKAAATALQRLCASRGIWFQHVRD